jgi:hypothetical protein
MRVVVFSIPCSYCGRHTRRLAWLGGSSGTLSGSEFSRHQPAVVSVRHLSFIVVTNPELALAAEAIGPETFERGRAVSSLAMIESKGEDDLRGRHAVVGEEQPEAEDGLGQDIENSIGDDLSIKADETGTVGNTPDDWVDGPEDEGEASNGTVESLGLAVLVGNGGAAVESELVDDNEEGNAGPGVPAPLLAVLVTIGSKETSEDHDDIGNKSHEDVGTTETGKQRKIEQEKRSGDAPVDITSPVDLTVDNLFGVWDVLVALLDHNLVQVDTITGGHGKV